jgi:hypothetical protein
MKKLISLLVLAAISVGCTTVVVVDEDVVKAFKKSDCVCTKTAHCKDAKCPVPTAKAVK